jgi:hypothetical protein
MKVSDNMVGEEMTIKIFDDTGKFLTKVVISETND